MDFLFHRSDFPPEGIALEDVALSDGTQPLPHHGLGIGNDWDGGRVILSNGLAVQQDMHHRFRQLQAHPGGRAVGKDGTQNQDQVATPQPLMHRVLTPDSPAQRLAQGEGMVLGKRSLGAVGSDHRRTEGLGQAYDFLAAAQHLHLFADHDNRAFGVPQQLEGLFHLVGVALGRDGVPRSQHLDIGLDRKQIGGYLQFDGRGRRV